MPVKIERHMLALNFIQSTDYFDWCWANGFDGSLEKSAMDLREEIEAYQTEQIKRKSHAKLHRNPKAFLAAVCQGELSSDEIDRPVFKLAAAEIEASKEDAEARSSLLSMLSHLTIFGDFIFQTVPNRDETPFIRGLIKLHDRKALWLRPLEEWKPKSKNRERMFGELTHHLFDKFGDVPTFMEAVWLRNDRPSWRYRDWFVHLGRGYNLRKAKSVIPLTKKMAHHYLQAPDNYTVEQAIRWGQMKALGCSDAAVDAVAGSRLGRSLVNEEFWFTVLRFFANNPMLDPRQIGPIVDYLQNQRFESIEVEIEPGNWRTDPPAQPSLSMNGRTVDTLLKQVDAWHQSLGKLRNLPSGLYEKAPFDGIVIEKRRGDKIERWVIRQLLSAKDLQVESDDLRHCVASYHWSCARGYCTIWSLAVGVDHQKLERRQTIEVDSNGMIVQCRGLANRDPTTHEWSIVNSWAREANLQVSGYL
ncbi:PcfJ domain-containing protein [Parasphingorhabdus sp.]|uniref:PcfJ domain-containing protein n=1 Tax=Parasphingorhabdus sp. TaxID=2709688 RepID=UPI003BB1758F